MILSTSEKAKQIRELKISELNELLSHKRRIINNLIEFRNGNVNYLFELNKHLNDLERLNYKLDILLKPITILSK